MPFDDPRCIELFRKAGELKCPVVLHLDWPWLPNAEGKREYQPLWYGGTVENLARALEACPETNFIGHAPGFWRDISGDAATDPAAYPRGPVTPGGRVIAMLEKYPNLYADLSAGSGRYALERDPEHAKKFLVQFQDKLLFGRDYYEQDLHKFLSTLKLDEAVAGKIYAGNAMRLVKP
jgi:predicted TIM-barrel fold metal-dependent hydrolase